MNRAEADQIALAVQQYVGWFGIEPPLYQFVHKPRCLAEEIRAAVAWGKKLTDEDLYRRLEMQWPDAGTMTRLRTLDAAGRKAVRRAKAEEAPSCRPTRTPGTPSCRWRRPIAGSFAGRSGHGAWIRLASRR
jgi:hypothetical protein